MWFWWLFIMVVIFFAGIVTGAMQGPDTVRVSDITRTIFYCLMGGAAVGVAVVSGFATYIFYVDPGKERRLQKEQELDYARAALDAEKKKLRGYMQERISALHQKNEEAIRERCEQALKDQEFALRRRIEGEVENRYRSLLEQKQGRSPRSGEGRRTIRKPVEKPIKYQASDGIAYARLREGKPLEKEI